MENNKLMLLYGYAKDELSFFDNLIKEVSVPMYRLIENSMANMEIKDIIEGLKIDTYDKDLPQEKVVLFNNFTDNELDILIKQIRSNSTSKPILAIVTPTSINWEFHYLLEHLLEEREQARRLMNQKRT